MYFDGNKNYFQICIQQNFKSLSKILFVRVKERTAPRRTEISI